MPLQRTALGWHAVSAHEAHLEPPGLMPQGSEQCFFTHSK